MTRMQPLDGYGTERLSRKSTVFLEKTARSIVEIQPSLDSVPEIVVFLEVLGYNNKTANENGFSDLYQVAGRLHDILDRYVDGNRARLMQERRDRPPPLAWRRHRETRARRPGPPTRVRL